MEHMKLYIYIIVLVYLTEISNGAYEAIYIIVLVYLAEISNGVHEAIYIIVLVFPEFNIRLYDKNSESDFFFFLGPIIRPI